MLALLALVSCATPEKRPPPAQPPPVTQVFFYPTQGQSAERQQRDRYECYVWARKQTGFDPSQPLLAPHQRFEVVVPSPPPGHDTAVGAVTGAVLGAVVAPPGRAAEGAVVGAVAGATLGAASDVARQEAAARTQRRLDARQRAQLEQQAADYRRAMTACLEGRGYTVR
jgi:hypothetical protein